MVLRAELTTGNKQVVTAAVHRSNAQRHQPGVSKTREHPGPQPAPVPVLEVDATVSLKVAPAQPLQTTLASPGNDQRPH